jgi:hypothetical protein
MPVPDFTPDTRPEPAATAPAGGYPAGRRVWIFTQHAWHPGHVLHSTDRAVTLRYRRTAERGTVVDTVTTDHLAPREEDDIVDEGYVLAPWD